MEPPAASMMVASGGTTGAIAAGPTYVIRPLTATTTASGKGEPPLPSINWPLRMTSVPLWVFMRELGGAEWGPACRLLNVRRLPDGQHIRPLLPDASLRGDWTSALLPDRGNTREIGVFFELFP